MMADYNANTTVDILNMFDAYDENNSKNNENLSTEIPVIDILEYYLSIVPLLT